MSKKTKGLRKQAKKDKKAVKKARKEDKKIDTSSVPLKYPFATERRAVGGEPDPCHPSTKVFGRY